MTDTPNQADKLTVTQADRERAADNVQSRAMAAQIRIGKADDHPLVQAFARHRTAHSGEGRELLQAVADSQEVKPYRGWNLKKLNAAANKIRAHLGLPSIRELNPDIAKMQDHAEANKDAIQSLIANPSGEGRSNGAGEEISRIVHENGPVVVDRMGEGLAWRPLDYGTWTPLAALATHQGEGEILREALGKAIVFSAYRASDPLAIRFEFANDEDRVAAADAVDEMFLLGAHGIRAALVQPEAGGERE